jgi:hypothetical protein
MRNSLVRMTFLSLALALAATAGAQDKAKPEGKKAPPVDPKQQAMMEAWQKASTPGPQHKELAAMAGHWDVTVTSYEGPAPEVSKGKAVRKMIFGGRYLQEDYEGTYMGQPFQGTGFTGYDNVMKKYILFWTDSMSTTFMLGDGQMDASGKVLTALMTFSDPISGKPVKTREVMKREGPDQETFEMYVPGPDGKEVKMMEMTYKRVK